MKYKKWIALSVCTSLLFSSMLWALPTQNPRNNRGISSRSLSTSQTQRSTQLSTISSNLTESFTNLTQLITATSYIAGLGFAVAGIMKFKAHKDNPTQVQVGQPLSLVLNAGSLLFLPTMESSEAVAKVGPYGTIEPIN